MRACGARGSRRDRGDKHWGFTLDRPPAEIRPGDVLRLTEPEFERFECFAPTNACAVTPFCRLPRTVGEALDAFMAVMDRHTLADVVLRPQDFAAMSRDGRELASLSAHDP